MPQFKYTARAANGDLIDGIVQANDRAAAIFEIEKEKRTPIRIETANDAFATAVKKTTTNESVTTLPLNQQFLFTEQTGHLLSAGMTLDESLGILERRLKQPKLQSLAHGLHRALVDGRSFSQALRDYPRIFSPLYVNMVSAGEASGSLPLIMQRLVQHLSSIKALRDRVQQALVYPSVLFVAGVLLITVFMVKMVPQLTGFLKNTGSTLPAPTRLLLSINHAIVNYWWLAGLCVAGAFFAWKVFTRAPEGRCAWDRFILGIPGYGPLARHRYYVQFARTLGTLMENGVTLLKALELIEDIAGNAFIRREMVKTRAAVADGASLSNALRAAGVFPDLFLDMMAVGEQTGHASETMQMIANVYDRELDKKVQIISTLIPLVIMIAIALLVGLVVFGILSAVFNITSGLHH